MCCDELSEKIFVTMLIRGQRRQLSCLSFLRHWILFPGLNMEITLKLLLQRTLILRPPS